MTDRGAVALTDIIIAAVVVIAGVATSPVYYELIGPIAAEADPFSQLMLQLVVPSIFMGTIISIGVSARRAT